MKRVVFIAICVFGLVAISSCRSSSKPCGLADNSTTTNQQHQQLAV